MNYGVDDDGFYGEFGGAFIPEILYRNVEELKENFEQLKSDPQFQVEFKELLEDYVGRPSPLYHAKRLSARYNTTIYLKREDLNHTGSHKINNTIGQILLAKKMGKQKIIAETGAGQHGVATATVCALMGLECKVFMGETDIERQKPNVERMKLLGAEVIPATSGSKTLKDACNEAIRYWIGHPSDTYYIIGSVVGPAPYPEMVMYFQAIISKEIKSQLKSKTGRESPDAVIACVGGGSNAAGAFAHFMEDENIRLIGAEAAGMGVDTMEHAATICKGSKGVLHSSRTLLIQDQDGQIIEPYSISAGLDYPGIGPLHAHLYQTGRAKYYPVTDTEALSAAEELMQLEGIIPALESAHALAILNKIKFNADEQIVICLSGRGDKDLATFIERSGGHAEGLNFK